MMASFSHTKIRLMIIADEDLSRTYLRNKLLSSAMLDKLLTESYVNIVQKE
jgi:hypothetical protein